jgi:HEAT repeat protein
MRSHALIFVAALVFFPNFASAQDKKGEHKELLDSLARGDKESLPIVVKKGETIFPELTQLLETRPRDDNQSLIIRAVADIASEVGPKAKGAIPVLCMLLRSQDRAVASEAVRALGYIGPGATDEVVKTLKKLDGEPELVNGLRALRQIGPGAKASAPALVQILKAHKEPHLRLACIDALGAVGTSGKATVDALLDVAKEIDKDKTPSPYKVQLILALGNQGADGKAAIPYLVAAIRQGPEPHVRIHALESLVKISPASKDVDAAVALLFEQPHVPKVMVLECLNKAGPLSKEMNKAVQELMRDKDAAVRLQAALVIGKKNADHPAVVSILIESLKDKNPRTRRTAAETIGEFRPTDEAVIEALQSRAKDADPAVRKAVVSALEKLKKKS